MHQLLMQVLPALVCTYLSMLILTYLKFNVMQELFYSSNNYLIVSEFPELIRHISLFKFESHFKTD